MVIDVRYGRCGKVFVTLHGSFDSMAADRLHDVLAESDPALPVLIDFQEVRLVEPLALAVLASESQVPGRSLTVTGLSHRYQRLLADYARQPRN